MASPELKLATEYVAEVERALGDMWLNPQRANRYTFDVVALGIVNKGFALFRACLTLIEGGFAEEAFGLSRSLLECSLNLKFITQDPTRLEERTRLFYLEDLKWRRRWLETSRNHVSDPAVLSSIEEASEAHRIEEKMPKSPGRGHWSGWRTFTCEINDKAHPINPWEDASSHSGDPVVNLEKLSKLRYESEYSDASAYVHCSQVAVNSYLPRPGSLHGAYRVSGNQRDQSLVTHRTLWSLANSLHAVMVYALFGMGLDRRSTLTPILHKFMVALRDLAE